MRSGWRGTSTQTTQETVKRHHSVLSKKLSQQDKMKWFNFYYCVHVLPLRNFRSPSFKNIPDTSHGFDNHMMNDIGLVELHGMLMQANRFVVEHNNATITKSSPTPPSLYTSESTAFNLCIFIDAALVRMCGGAPKRQEITETSSLLLSVPNPGNMSNMQKLLNKIITVPLCQQYQPCSPPVKRLQVNKQKLQSLSFSSVLSMLMKKAMPLRCISRHFANKLQMTCSHSDDAKHRVYSIMLASLLGNYDHHHECVYRPTLQTRIRLINAFDTDLMPRTNKQDNCDDIQWASICETTKTKLWEGINGKAWKLWLFAFREYMVYLIDRNPAAQSYYTMLFDYNKFRMVVIDTMNSVRAYLQHNMRSFDQCTMSDQNIHDDQWIKDITLITTTAHNHVLNVNYTRPRESFMHTLFATRLHMPTSLQWIPIESRKDAFRYQSNNSAIKIKFPVSGTVTSQPDTELDALIKTTESKTVHTNIDDDEDDDVDNDVDDDVDNKSMADKKIIGTTTNTTATKKVRSIAETSVESTISEMAKMSEFEIKNRQCMSSVAVNISTLPPSALVFTDSDILLSHSLLLLKLVQCLPTWLPCDLAIEQVWSVLPKLGVSHLSVQSFQHVSKNKTTRRSRKEALYNICRKYPYTYALLQTFVTLWHWYTMFKTYDLPWPYPIHQANATNGKMSMSMYVTETKTNDIVILDFMTKLHYCRVCGWIYSLYTEHDSKKQKQHYRFGYKNMTVNVATGDGFCKKDHTYAHMNCSDTKIQEMNILGKVVTINSKTFMICPQPGCGMIMSINPGHRITNEYGLACSRCIVNITTEKETQYEKLACPFLRIPFLVTEKDHHLLYKCFKCHKSIVGADALYIMGYQTFLCAEHGNSKILVGFIKAALKTKGHVAFADDPSMWSNTEMKSLPPIQAWEQTIRNSIIEFSVNKHKKMLKQTDLDRNRAALKRDKQATQRLKMQRK